MIHCLPITHLRLPSAHCTEPLPAPGAAQACPMCLRSPTNQLTSQGDSRQHRPIEKAARFTPVLSQLGGFTRERPAIIRSRTLATDALIGDRRAGSQGVRPLAPLPFTAIPNQRNSTDPLGFARPFVPSSPSPKPRLRVNRIGGLTSFDLLPGALGNGFRDSSDDLAQLSGLSYLRGRFPGSNNRQDSTSPGGMCRRAANAHLPWLLRMSGMLRKRVTFFISRHLTKNH